MNWLTKAISKVFPKKKKSLDVPENSWLKCNKCQAMLYHTDLEKSLFVCKNCDFHLQIHPRLRLKNLFDGGEFEELEYDDRFSDPLNWKDRVSYKQRWQEARDSAGTNEVFLLGVGKINGIRTCVAAMNYFFLNGSVGISGAEALIKGSEFCVSENIPLVIFGCSGGMRMQTGILSLSTLQKMTIAMSLVKDAGLPTVNVIVDPCFGGTMASYMSLSHVILAEPEARAGFAGRRVVEQVAGEELSPDFQSSENLLKNGQIDMIVHRADMKNKLSTILSLLLKKVA
tara:strand:- start:1901 stop:2755 length:855 start_codon:yes stop_codon:yes gene_type:complete